jgi:hypothetical protein
MRSQLDKFTITKTGQHHIHSGPSLTFSGENAQPNSVNDGQINGENNDDDNSDNGKHLRLKKGEGKGLNSEHFTQQGPLRSRDLPR